MGDVWFDCNIDCAVSIVRLSCLYIMDIDLINFPSAQAFVEEAPAARRGLWKSESNQG